MADEDRVIVARMDTGEKKRWDGNAWVSVVNGDMSKSTYDPDNDGKIAASELNILTGLTKITVGTSEPSNPTVGDLWCDTS